MVFQLLGVPGAYALTSGPSQPEMQSFQPAGTNNMVDLFTGDFSYNIPLFELPGPNGGYPFNLSYQSGIGMDQEASWVGLGWTLQPGAITRQMRGLPDEFKGDIIKTKMSISPSVTVGLGAGASVEVFGAAAELGIGFSVYQNSYSGMGYSVDANLGFEKTIKGITSGLSLGLSLDSKEGVGVNPSLSLGGKVGQYGLGAGYNSKQGLTNIGLSMSSGTPIAYADGKKTWSAKIGSMTTLTMAHPGYTPQITMPMRNISLSANFKAGAAWWGIFGAPYVNGFYSEQWLANDKQWVQSKGYGYMNYQYASESDVLDFNREKDGIVSKESSNLGLPSLTYDIYSVTGQGIGMMYRPMRNDYGIVYDQKMKSVSNAVGVGVDVGPAASHVGVNLNVNHSKSSSGKWTENNELLGSATFQKKKTDELYEPWHFQVHGEPTSQSSHTLEKIGGDHAVRLQLTNGNENTIVSNNLERKDVDNGLTVALPSPKNKTDNRERKPRTNSVHSITNGELLNSVGEEMLSYFKVRYIDNTGGEKDFARSIDAQDQHHFAGHTALTADGLRYVYAIPAYNTYQEEVVFSTQKQIVEGRVNVNAVGNEPGYEAPGTNKFLKRTELPKYAHSHLLTSILGPDYVDVTNDGVTADDLGYWVKFTYQKTTTDAAPYKWRDPYIRAHFQEGWKSDPRDDKGSFVYGEKEIWYLARAETKSHIAEFSLETRDDGRGVYAKLQDSAPVKGATLHRLKKITLYTRASGPSNPIKVTRFDYNYSLCPGIENSSTGEGKLTLKKVWFEYGQSTRGSLNPYKFSYNNEIDPIPYDANAYDRWGNYKPYPDRDTLFNQDFPYAEQDSARKTSIDSNAAAWSLKEIGLPSGGTIMVDYESDDYAYVQNKTAMQMMSVVDPYTNPTLPLATEFELVKSQSDYLKIRFKLEGPLPGNSPATQQAETILKYLDTDTWQLYFKLLMSLRSAPEGVDEYIMGYADVNQSPSTMGLEKGLSGDFEYGYFHLIGEDGGSAGSNLHPFSMRAWQHLRTNQPELTNSGRVLEQTDDPGTRINQIKSLAGAGAQISQMFKGFYKYCHDKNWGKTVKSGKSWIRLNSPDKIKYGGGLRVKQITIKDQWSQDDEGIYGQAYDYTTLEGSQVISSGVAAYEPIFGGDENAMHYAKKYTQSAPLVRTDNNFFFEYPVNESYYPGPQVGYSKVTVMSLASASLSGKSTINTKLSDNAELFPTGANINYGTSGKVIHEFYTARDYPVITDETDKLNKQYKLAVPVPFLGSITVNKLTATQGYSIITNDMHGKQKRVSNYRQNKAGIFEQEPISWVQYKYNSVEDVRDGKTILKLQNTFKVNPEDGTLSVALPDEITNPLVEKGHLAQETEFFHDMRQFEDISWGGGARYNTDIVYIPILFAIIPIPAPTVWPSVSKGTSLLRTAVSNKVIFRSGILVEVEAFDGGSIAKTTNHKWDRLTGSTVLTSTNNNFDDLVYSYTIPAFNEYRGMGAAYKNLGLNFIAKNFKTDPYKENIYRFNPSQAVGEELFRGDEVLLYEKGSQFENPVSMAIYMGLSDDGHTFYSEEPLSSSAYECKIVRSGFRNQLTVAASTITALENPSIKGPEVMYSKTITVPK